MSFLNGNKFADRQAAAANARKAMAEKFLANSKYDPTDPAIIEREAKRKAILEARVIATPSAPSARRRKRRRKPHGARLRRRPAGAVEARGPCREAEAQRQREVEAQLEYEKKLERDARYAARKERKKKKKSASERYG